MSFQFRGLNQRLFAHLYNLSDKALLQTGVHVYQVDSAIGFPCRVSLQEAPIGSRVLLLNYQHLTGASPYAASHAIFVKEDAEEAQLSENEIPEIIWQRPMISVRAFDGDNMMLDAAVGKGEDAESLVAQYFDYADCEFLQVHSATRGCYLAQAVRA